jgi:hypothetical protein
MQAPFGYAMTCFADMGSDMESTPDVGELMQNLRRHACALVLHILAGLLNTVAVAQITATRSRNRRSGTPATNDRTILIERTHEGRDVPSIQNGGHSGIQTALIVLQLREAIGSGMVQGPRLVDSNMGNS